MNENNKETQVNDLVAELIGMIGIVAIATVSYAIGMVAGLFQMALFIVSDPLAEVGSLGQQPNRF